MLEVIKISCRNRKWEKKWMSAFGGGVGEQINDCSWCMGDAHEPSCRVLKAEMWMMKQVC